MNYIDFSKRIKEKYPYYDKIDDKVLAEKIIEKYPYYKDKVTFDDNGNKVTITDVIKDVFNTATQPIRTLTDTSVKAKDTIEQAIEPATKTIGETIKQTLNPIEQTKSLAEQATVKQYNNVEPILRARTKEDDNAKVIYEPDSFDILADKIAVTSATDKGVTSTKDLEDIRKKQNFAIMSAGVVPFVAGGQMSVGGLAILEGIQQAKNYASSKIQGKDYDFMAYENLSSLLPDNTPSVVRVVSSLAEMVADCVVAGRLETTGRNFLINEAVGRLETKMKGAGYTEEQVKTASNNLKKEIVQRETGLKEENGQVVQTETKPINIDDAVKLNVDVERLKVPKAEQPKETIKADVEVEPITEPKQIKQQSDLEDVTIERVAKILPRGDITNGDHELSLYKQTAYNHLIKDGIFTNGKIVILDKDVAKKTYDISKQNVINEFAKLQKGNKAQKIKKATEIYEKAEGNAPNLDKKYIPNINALIKKGDDGIEKTSIVATEDNGKWSVLEDNKTTINTEFYNAIQKEFNNELEIYINRAKNVATLKDKEGNTKAILPALKTNKQTKIEDLQEDIKIISKDIENIKNKLSSNTNKEYEIEELKNNLKKQEDRLKENQDELAELQEGNTNVATSKTDFSKQTDVELPTITKTHEELIKKSEIIRDLAKETDLPVKIGGTGRKNILGLYYQKEELVRLQVANDMLTLAHEIGHHEEKVLFGSVYRKYKDFTPEEKEFYKELKPLATKPAGNETRGKMFSEGMAQFISMFVNNPAQAQKVAPKFYEFFTTQAPIKTPKVYEALTKAQARMSKYYSQTPINKVKNHISFVREMENLTPKEWLDKTITLLKTQVVDRLEPLRKAVQDVYERAGLTISDTDVNNPYFIARMNAGSVGRAEVFIKNGTYDFNTLKTTGKGFQSIIQDVEKNGGNLEDFATYLVAHDTIELSKRGINTGVEVADAQKTVNDLSPVYEKYAQELYQYRLSLLKILRDSQVISPEAYNNIVNKSERYAPLQRVLDDETNNAVGTKNFKSSNPIKSIKGSGRDIINPLETILNETYNVIKVAEKNRVGLALANLAKLDKSGAFIFKRPHKVKAVRTLDDKEEFTIDNTIDKNNEIKVFQNGKPVVYEVEPNIAKVINGLALESQIIYSNYLDKVATLPARMLKFGATDVNVAFAFKNILRDLPLALISSENKFDEITKSVLQMTVLGLKALTNDKARVEWNNIVDLYSKSGAGQSLLINDNRNSTIKAIDDLRYTGYLDKIWNKVKEKDFVEAVKTGIVGTTEAVRALVGFLEQVPRLAEFVASLKGKPLTKENLEKAGFNARKITLDFASGGTLSKWVNKYVPYSNAFVLGISKLAEVIKTPKMFKRLLGMLGVYALGVMIERAINGEDEEVNDVNRTQKYTNFVFKVGDTIYRIPKTIELAPFYTTIDTAINFVFDKAEGKKRDDYLKDILGSFKSNLAPNVIAQSLKLPIELYANKSMYFGTPIVSAELEKVLPEYQYTEYTTELAKFIGKTLGDIGINEGVIEQTIGSPQRLEYIVNSLTGNTGKYLFEKIDQIGRLTGVLPEKEYELPEKTLADIPFARAFVIRYPQQSRSIEDFYEKYNELKKYSATFKLAKKRADFETLNKMAIYKSIDKVANISATMSDIRKSILATYIAKDISKDQKRQLIDELMLSRVSLAKEGLRMIKEIEDNINEEKK